MCDCGLLVCCLLLLRERETAGRERMRELGAEVLNKPWCGWRVQHTHTQSVQIKKDTHAAWRVCDLFSTRARSPPNTHKKWWQTGGGHTKDSKPQVFKHFSHTHAPPPPPRWCASRRATSTGLVTPEDGTPTARARATSATLVIPFNSASVAGAVDAPAPAAIPDPLAPGAARLEGGASRSGVVPGRLAGADAAAPPADRAARAASSRCLR